MHSLALDPNSDDLRDLMRSLDPAAELPTKRPCFVVTAASGDANSFEVRTLSRFRDQYLLAARPSQTENSKPNHDNPGVYL